jgi:hypothetical protein
VKTSHPTLPRDLSLLSLERAYAVFSPCERYRYQLWWPTGIERGGIALGIFANPSTATAEQTDPTVRRWIGYCRDWGYSWAGVCNVRAWRETDPRKVPPDPEAIGADNDDHIIDCVREAALVVCGWGKLGGARGPHILQLIRNAGAVPSALKLNKDGSPCHPLYLAANLKPVPMARAAARDGGAE